MPKKICPSCNQVIPSSLEERQVANQRMTEVVREHEAAMSAWRHFYLEPKQRLWDIPLVMIFSILAGYYTLEFLDGYMEDGTRLVIATGLTVALYCLSSYLFWIKPAKKIERIKKEKKREFASLFPHHAKTLGFLETQSNSI